MKALHIIVGSLAAASLLQAEVTIDTVHVGDPDNPVDSTGYGSVSYEYRIGVWD